MRFLRRSLLGLFLLSLTVGFLALAGLTIMNALQERWADSENARPARERVYAVRVIEVEPVTVAPEIASFGEIRSRRTLEIRAAAAGEVIWLSDDFEEGAPVVGGQLLARIDARDAEGRRDTARSDLAEAEADLRDARRTLEIAEAELSAAEGQAALRDRALARQRDLLSRGVGTEALVEEAELSASDARQAVLSRRQALADAQSRIDQSLAALERLRIALEEAERRLADTEITAEFDGTLANVNIVQGGLVSSNEALARLVDPDALEVSFRVSAAQHARLLDSAGQLVGAPVTVSLDVSGIDIVAEGTITRESPAVGEGQTGRLLFARLEAAPGFRPGDFVTVRITEPPLTDVAVLPATALDAAETVLVIGAEDRLDVVSVRILRRQADDVIVAAADLAGRRVVAVRTPFLGAGIRVRAVEPGVGLTETTDLMELDAERRARLVAFVEANERMPKEAKARVLAQLRADRVPAAMVARLESRMGG